MTKQEAEKRIQELLAEVKQLADEHRVEFTWLGCTMHYYGEYDKKQKRPAKEGLLVSDEEWNSSNCYGPKSGWEEELYEQYPDD